MSEYFIKPIVKILMLKGQEGQSIKGIKKNRHKWACRHLHNNADRWHNVNLQQLKREEKI